MKQRIYLDYSASAPMDPRVKKAMDPYFSKIFGNPSSIHWFGREAQVAIDKARKEVADFLGCSPREIIFTSGATDADNLAIKGLVGAIQLEKGRAAEKIHIISSQIEHKAVLASLETEGIKVTCLPVNKEGIVGLDDLKRAITPETDLVSIMYANNEMGVIEPIREIGGVLSEINKDKAHRIYFHTDAVQAANWLDCDVDHLKVDLLTLSGHKIYGPKGIGVLYVREGTPIAPIIHGGEQEYGRRGGTENVPGVVGLGEAIRILKEEKTSQHIAEVRKLRDRIIKEVLKTIPGVKLNGPRTKRLPNNINFSFEGAEGESIVMALDQEGIAASTGSACTSKSLEPSHVLLALGLSEEEAHNSLRITLGRYTTEKEVNRFLEVLPKVIERLRKISGLSFTKD